MLLTEWMVVLNVIKYSQYKVGISVILFFTLYTIRYSEEHRLRVFEKRALRRLFGPKRDEVTGG
jgi:hypothetical protein